MSRRNYLPPSEVIERYRATHQVQGKTRGSLASAPEAPTNCTHTQEDREHESNKESAFFAVALLLGTSFIINVILIIKITLLQQ